MDYHGRFARIFSTYRENYIRIFNVLYPSKHSTGFTERNLSVNFAKSYNAENPSAVAWFEFQFGEENNLHYDAVIIDSSRKEILLIESKRFSNAVAKLREVVSDIGRINRAATVYRGEIAERITNFAEYTLYGVILADVWSKGKKKTAIWQSFKNQTFLDDFCFGLPEDDRRLLENSSCHVGDFADVPATVSDSIRNDYHLLALTWKLSPKV